MSQGDSNNKSYFIIVALSVVLLLMATTIYASSQSVSENGAVNTININGNAEKMVEPDTATMSIGVVIQAPTAKQAAQENAAIMSEVMEELNATGLQDEEIQTSQVSVYPVYNYDGKATIEGYSASNNVRVTTTKLDILGEIIDRSAAAGANQIGGISFTVSDEMEKELQEELISEAVADASSKAEMLASSLGVRISGVKTSSINDNSQPGIYYEREMAMDESSASTPVQPGKSPVSLSVHVTYIIV
ncbi:SIMPL domain-containing protein [Methanolobus halotolerans]|uniref:SIMPL domain-containing protein n=1 Tax=Methanolobus halotolerans TaxID=2052935 RepID=A0A4E0Q2G5_9EURY|nr:SIMPL domain-containing protein [Methanolobus halotolerans]TGC06933.1 hypothetical protein CUN85_12395 [Methanolobus halotolerans]